MPWSRQVNHIQAILLYQTIQVYVDKRQARTRSPVSEEPVLDMFRSQRFLQQRIVLQIGHSQAQVVTCPPIGVDFLQRLVAERLALYGGPCRAVRAQRTVHSCV